MRFREFSKVDEAIPAVTSRDLKSLNPATIQATKNLAGKISNKIASAVGKPTDPNADKTQVPPGLQAQANVQPSAIQQAQAQAADKTQQKPEIPAVGSQLVLPDKDTKKPGSFTIGNIRGDNITLKPVKTDPTQPKVDVTVKKTDLEKTLSAVDPKADSSTNTNPVKATTMRASLK
jgi:hypothetical protein